MWSHYAIVTRVFVSNLISQRHLSGVPILSCTSEKRRLYDLSAVHEKTNATNLLLTKYEDWRYEEEWRIIVEKAGATYPSPPEALTGVIFGCRTSEADKVKLTNWISQRPCNALLYQARLSSRQFRLDIERC
jgi:hypothetical protein